MPELHQLKRELLGELEKWSEIGEIDLYYGDETSVSLEPNVLDGWQFADETVSMQSEKGAGINCFGLLTRSNQSWTATSEKPIDAALVVEQLERFSFPLEKMTVVVLDNARIHTGKKMRERIGAWQERGLFVFYLPTYSPHLNIAETVWRKLKYEWLSVADYESKGHLQYAVSLVLSGFGRSLKIRFSGFKHSLV